MLYGSGNSDLLAKMVGNIFKNQPKYSDDLVSVVPTVLHVRRDLSGQKIRRKEFGDAIKPRINTSCRRARWCWKKLVDKHFVFYILISILCTIRHVGCVARQTCLSSPESKNKQRTRASFHCLSCFYGL